MMKLLHVSPEPSVEPKRERKSSQRSYQMSICNSYWLSECLALNLSYLTSSTDHQKICLPAQDFLATMGSVSKTATLSSKLHVGKGRAHILQTRNEPTASGYTLNNFKKIVPTFVYDNSDFRNNSRFVVEYSHKSKL